MSLSSQSLIGAGLQVTRLASTVESISENPPHWCIESYIPVQNAELVAALLRRSDCPTYPDDLLPRIFIAMNALLHHHGRSRHFGFASRYAEIDPDRDTRIVASSPATDVQERLDADRIAEVSRTVLNDAGFREINRAELEKAVGFASEWGVPLHVDFDVFDLLLVYGRGDIIGAKKKRRWRQWFRNVDVEVPLYQRVVVMFKLREGSITEDQLDSSMLHLRMFKNVPKVDIDMLLPGTRIRLSWFDRTRSIVPSLGGIGIQIYKLVRLALFVAVITYSIAAMIIGLTLAIIGYVVRSVINYLQTRNRYMLNLTRSLYYQKLDTNAGVAFRLLFEAEAQRHREVVLAYYALLSAGEPISLRKLKRRVERMVRETIQVEVDFRVTDAIELLDSWNLLVRDSEGKVQVVAPEQALKQLDQCWDRAIP